MSRFLRDSGLIPMTPTSDHTDKKGYLVKNSSGSALINDSATVAALGVILDGETTSGKSTIGVFGCLNGTVPMVAGGAITQWAEVQQQNDGTVVVDAGTGNRVVVGRAVEAAATGEQFEVVPYNPPQART